MVTVTLRSARQDSGFTILESFIVLLLLAVLSALILALIKHQTEPEIPDHLRTMEVEAQSTGTIGE